MLNRYGLRLSTPGGEISYRGMAFRKLFKPLMGRLDARRWYVPVPPWMGCPLELEDEYDRAVVGAVRRLQGVVWKPGTLGRFADHILEEGVSFWSFGIQDTPEEIVAFIDQLGTDAPSPAIAERAELALLCSERFEWDVFAEDEDILDAIRDHVAGLNWVKATRVDLSAWC